MKYTKKKYIRKRTKRARGKSRVTKRHRRYKKKSFLLVGGNDPCNYKTNDETLQNFAMHACEYRKMIDELDKQKSGFDCINKPLKCENNPVLKRIIQCPEELTLNKCEELLVTDYNSVMKDLNYFISLDNDNDQNKILDKFNNDVLLESVLERNFLKKNIIANYYREADMRNSDDYDTVEQKHNTLMRKLNEDPINNKEKIEKYAGIYEEIKKQLEKLQKKKVNNDGED